MVGAFEKRTIEAFLKRLALGQETAAVKRYESPLPAVVQHEPWDGKDGEIPVDGESDGGDGKDEL
eukprot:COSAG02_NODE_4237_length_5599_cov_6.352000_7_plen_65_part_00